MATISLKKAKKRSFYKSLLFLQKSESSFQFVEKQTKPDSFYQHVNQRIGIWLIGKGKNTPEKFPGAFLN